MTRLTQDEAIEVYKGVIVMAVDILMDKRKDYSGEDDPFGNLRVAEHHGVHPVVGTNIRCNDKLARISRIVQADSVEEGGLVGESVVDDIRDVVNYMTISAGLLAEEHPDLKRILFEAASRWDIMGNGFNMEPTTAAGSLLFPEQPPKYTYGDPK